ncbi:MAG: hypothetical protein ACLGI3_17885, partial [Actinomycetes bacterium]
LAHLGVVDDGIEQRPDPPRFVPRRHHHRHRARDLPSLRRERRRPPRPRQQAADDHSPGHGLRE